MNGGPSVAQLTAGRERPLATLISEVQLAGFGRKRKHTGAGRSAVTQLALCVVAVRHCLEASQLTPTCRREP